jgi:phage terminase small subunit
MALTPRYKAFVAEYLACFNGAEAARRVGYSPKSAYQHAWRMLKNVEVLEALKAGLSERAMPSEEVLARLAAQARGTWSPFIRITPEGHVEFDFTNGEAANNMHLVKKIHTKRKQLVELGTGGKGKPADVWEHEWVEVELYDSQAALALIGKYHKLFTEKIETVHTLNVEGFQQDLERIFGKRNGKK